MPKNAYLCIEMSGKGSISRMSDECLITLETVFSYCNDCQAVMRKFTLAGKAKAMRLHLPTNILHSFPFLLKVQGHGGTPFHTPTHYSPAPQYTMPNTYLDKAIAAIPKFEERI